jgi:hypothetical protein
VIILVATIALAALEVWLFWLAGKRVHRRRAFRRNDAQSTGSSGSVTHLRSRPRRRGWRQRLAR